MFYLTILRNSFNISFFFLKNCEYESEHREGGLYFDGTCYGVYLWFLWKGLNLGFDLGI